MSSQTQLQVTPSAGLSRAEMDQFTLLQLPLQPLHLAKYLWGKLALKERATINETKHEREQNQGGKSAAELLL